MKILKWLPIFIIILVLIIFNAIFFGLRFIPDEIGLRTGSEKSIALYVPVKAQVVEGNVQMQQEGGFAPFSTITLSSQSSGRSIVKLSFFGITVKELNIAAIDDVKIVPSGQIIGISEGKGGLFAGTVTFYDKETGKYGALAHGINDRTDEYKINDGKIYYTDGGSVVKGTDGTMGSLSGNIYVDRQTGTVEKNTQYGIFGTIYDNFAKSGHIPTEVALSDEVKTGKAQIVSDVEGTGVREYDAEIISVGTDRFILNISDSGLIEKTGGIVHGMSGTPVIQNNKIVGALSAGEEDSPEKIYCVYIQDMLVDFQSQE